MTKIFKPNGEAIEVKPAPTPKPSMGREIKIGLPIGPAFWVFVSLIMAVSFIGLPILFCLTD